jgi:acyl dehydratase
VTTLGSLEVGDTHSQVLVDGLTRTQIVMYAGASGDYNPLHTDEVYARQVGGYPSTFAHGLLSMGLTGRLITDWVEDAEVAAFSVRFSRQVWPGDTLTGTARVTTTREGSVGLEVTTSNQDGQTVLTGTVRLRPSEVPVG